MKKEKDGEEKKKLRRNNYNNGFVGVRSSDKSNHTILHVPYIAYLTAFFIVLHIAYPTK